MSHLIDETSYMSPALCKRRFFCVDCLRHPWLPSPSTKKAFFVDEPPFYMSPL